MSRYRGPRLKILKRLGPLPGFGQKLNQKFQEANTSLVKTNRKKKSPFTIRLKEKQKLRYNYGLTEKNLIQYMKIARKKKTSTGETLLKSLEMRLDNIVFRLGFGPTLPAARQLITHGHILLNGKKRNKPSSQCSLQDSITLKTPHMASIPSSDSVPGFLSLETSTLTGKVQQLVSRQEVDFSINELLVIEYYSRNF
uniref:Small ribosomal subunit protein uS4c n=1 Tax=Pseudocodium devriesii TaxID=453070 RepID=A0A386B119_9CHLO|nr:ribosomal protein S4 [Pseudocodium devriesii]AYC65387.1 ribosomal protein S4 [Pseudocodium devriesii]